MARTKFETKLNTNKKIKKIMGGWGGGSRIQEYASGRVIGSGDRALGCKACANGATRTNTLTPRVLAPQNRMRLTRSPCHLQK